MWIPYARTDLAPVTISGDPIREPTRIVLQRVVEVDPVQDGSAGALVGDGVGEDDEAEERGYDDEHGPQVEVHEEVVAVARAGETSEWDDHDGDADDDERPLEELHAVGVVGAAAQPDSAAQDGDWEDEGEEVEEPY